MKINNKLNIVNMSTSSSFTPSVIIVPTPQTQPSVNQASPIRHGAQTPQQLSPPRQFDPFGYITPYNYPPSTPSMLEPDNLEDLFEDEARS